MKANFSKIIEFKRLSEWVVHELVATYGFPAKWVDERIHVSQQRGDVKSTIEVTLASGEPFLNCIIYTAGSLDFARKDAEERLKKEPTLGLFFFTDGTESGSNWMRRRFDRGVLEEIPDFEGYSIKKLGNMQLSFIKSDKQGLSKTQKQVPLNERIENVFYELHSHIRDIDGLHADVALDELCKIIYAKLFDEEQCREGQEFAFQSNIYGTTEEIAATVRLLYKNAGAYDARVFGLKIPQYERSRGVFSTMIQLSSPAIARLVEELQGFNITASSIDVKGRAFQKMLLPGLRAGMGQYFTPAPVVQFIVESLSPDVRDLILDPFCGSGHFLTKSLEFVRQNSKEDPKLLSEFAFGKLHGIEKSDRMVRIAMTDMRLHGDGHSNVRCTDALLDWDNYPDLIKGSFDLILTNPPFGSILNPESINNLGKFQLAAPGRKVPLEILGIERCLEFLRPGGRIGIVIPDGILTNRSTKEVREFLRIKSKILGVVSLPIETFTPFGANIKTSILFLRKWRTGENKSDDYRVFMASVKNVGHDSRGKTVESNELSEVTREFKTFLQKEA